MSKFQTIEDIKSFFLLLSKNKIKSVTIDRPEIVNIRNVITQNSYLSMDFGSYRDLIDPHSYPISIYGVRIEECK